MATPDKQVSSETGNLHVCAQEPLIGKLTLTIYEDRLPQWRSFILCSHSDVLICKDERHSH